MGQTKLGQSKGCVKNPTSTEIFWLVSKAELPQEGILFCTQFPSLGIFINKKVGF